MKLNKIISLICATTLLCCNIYTYRINAETKLVAFPGAEGGGMYTAGARGSESIEIYHVTNLNDSGEGSFRDALTESNRMIVFDVAGNIFLKSAIRVNGVSNITILGQTAPGEGICVGGESTLFENCENIILRYVRFRPGDAGTSQEDALGIKRCKDFIVDHCSVTWSVDEALSAYANRNFTAQYNIIAQSLYDSVHEKGAHAYGGIWGGENASFHHNLIAHHYSRMPRIGTSQTVSTYNNDPDTDGLVDIRNNVFYNWVSRPGYGGENGVRVNFVGNFYKPGPSSQRKDQAFLGYAGATGTTVVYAEDNVMEGGSANFANVNLLNSISDTAEINGVQTKPNDEYTKDYPVSTISAQKAYTSVLDDVGANIYVDPIDKAIIESVKNKTAFEGSKGNEVRLIDSQEDVGGWVYLTGNKAADSDDDGIPDEWENENGLDKNDPDDSLHFSSTGYTYLEVYANGILNNTAVENTDTSDLRKLIYKAENINTDYYYEADVLKINSEVEKAKAALQLSQTEIDKEAEILQELLNSTDYRYKNLLSDLIEKVKNTDSSVYNSDEWAQLTKYVTKAENDLKQDENNQLFKEDYETIKNKFESMSTLYYRIYEQFARFRNTNASDYTSESYAKAMSALDELEQNIPEGLDYNGINDFCNLINNTFWENVEMINYSALDNALGYLNNTWDNQYLKSTDITEINRLKKEIEKLKVTTVDKNDDINELYNSTVELIDNIDNENLREYKKIIDFSKTSVQTVSGRTYSPRSLTQYGGETGIRATSGTAILFDILDEKGSNVYYGVRANSSCLALTLDNKYSVSIDSSAIALHNVDDYDLNSDNYIQIDDYRSEGLRNYIVNFNQENHLVTVYIDNVRYNLSVPEDAVEITEFGFISPGYYNDSYSTNLGAQFAKTYSFVFNENNESVKLYGDADNDGEITSNDSAVLMQKVLQAEKIMPIEEENDYMEIVDVNIDGTLTGADAAFVLQKTLDNTYKMPIER